MNEKFKTENAEIKARKSVIAFSGFYYSESGKYCSDQIDIIPKIEYTIYGSEV